MRLIDTESISDRVEESEKILRVQLDIKEFYFIQSLDSG